MLRYCLSSNVVGLRSKCTKSALNNTIHFGRNTSIQSNQYSNQFHCVLFCRAQNWYIFFPTPPPHEGNYLRSIATDKDSTAKQKELCTVQWYTIIIHYTSFPKNSRMVSKTFKTFCGDYKKNLLLKVENVLTCIIW